jgi:hypothetical protein
VVVRVDDDAAGVDHVLHYLREPFRAPGEDSSVG